MTHVDLDDAEANEVGPALAAAAIPISLHWRGSVVVLRTRTEVTAFLIGLDMGRDYEINRGTK